MSPGLFTCHPPPTAHPVVSPHCRRMGSAAGAPPSGSKGSKGARAWPELQQVAAHLYTVQGRHEEALELQLQVGGLMG